MKKKEWNEGLNHIDPDLVEKYVEQKDRLRQKNKKPKGVWLRFGAIAACFLLIVSAVIVVPMLREDEPSFQLPTDINNIIWNTDIGDAPDNSIEVPLWEGWQVDSYSLYQQLDKADPEQYFALHITKTFWEGFVYNGKTVAQIRQEKEDKYVLFDDKESIEEYARSLETKPEWEKIKFDKKINN